MIEPRAASRAHRAGFIIPLVVISGSILFIMVIAFQFLSSSDYKRVARMMRDVQASSLADLASDEVHLQVAQITPGPNQPGNSARPAWVSAMLTELKGKTAALINGEEVPVEAGRLDRGSLPTPVTDKAADLVRDLVDVKLIESSVGPFTLISHGLAKEDYYHERVLDTLDESVIPLDLRGPLKVAITIKGEGNGPINFSEVYYRGQEILITDTTPPASQFAVFSYMPPPSPEYAVEDLQAGATLNIRNNNQDARVGRIMIQGPLFFVPEAPPPQGSETPSRERFMSTNETAPIPLDGNNPGPTFPDAQWVGAAVAGPIAGSMATVPAPRALYHADRTTGTAPAGAAASKLGDVLVDLSQGNTDPRLPSRDESETKFQTKDYRFDIRVENPLPFNDAEFSLGMVRDVLFNGTLRDEVRRLSPGLGDILGEATSAIGAAIGGVFGGEGLAGRAKQRCTESMLLPVPVPRLGPMNVRGASAVVAPADNAAGPRVYQTIDKSPVGYYTPQAYLYPPVPARSQKLNILGGRGRGTYGMPNTTLQDKAYLGVFVSAPDTSGASTIRKKTVIEGTAEGDGHMLEPVPGADYEPWERRGLYGVYGIGRFEARTAVKVKLKWLVEWMVKVYIEEEWTVRDEEVPFCRFKDANGVMNKKTFRQVAEEVMPRAVEQALRQLNLDGELNFMVRRYKALGGLVLGSPKELKLETLTDAVGGRRAAFFPFGSYYAEPNFWNQSAMADMKTEMLKGLNEPTMGNVDQARVNEIFKDLFRRNKPMTDVEQDPFNDQTPNQNTPAGKMAYWLTDTFGPRYVRGAAPGPTLVEVLNTFKTEHSNKVVGLPPLTLTTEKRPIGAFGDHRGEAQSQFAGAGAAGTAGTGAGGAWLNDVKANFKKRGFFPPKFRQWEKIATRSYDTFEQYMTAESSGQILELRGAVLIRSCDYASNIEYKGRGIVILVTPEGGTAPKLKGQIRPHASAPDSVMILVHRVHESHLTGKALKFPALGLGTSFTGCVVSDTGVTPALGNEVTIVGNLVTGLLNLAGSNENHILNVRQDDRLASAVSTGANPPQGSRPMEDFWSIELSGEINSEQPNNSGG